MPYTWTCMTVPTVIVTCPQILVSPGRVGLSGTSVMEIQPSCLLTGYKPVYASAPCQLGCVPRQAGGALEGLHQPRSAS